VRTSVDQSLGEHPLLPLVIYLRYETVQEFKRSERLANWQSGVGHRVSGRAGGVRSCAARIPSAVQRIETLRRDGRRRVKKI
jgi:hypothetical protein